MSKRQDAYNEKMLYALGQLLEAMKLQQVMITDLKEYIDKRELMHEQMNRMIVDLLTKVTKT